jgi:hypothetical protein
MTASVELVALKCLNCGTLIEAEEEEVAWVCQQCGQGLRLDAQSNLAALVVHWAALPAGRQTAGLRWLPFWVFSGSVHFSLRSAFHATRQPDPLWNAPRHFFVPAFPYSLESTERLGADLTRRQPQLTAGQPQSPVSQCTLFAEDAREVVEFVVLTIEADQKDKLRQVSFQLELAEPELWVLPFTEQGTLQLAL